MHSTNHPLCPICQALTIIKPILIDTFLEQFRSLLCRLTCCCAEACGAPLLAHPHIREGCVGYLEVPDEEVGHA